MYIIIVIFESLPFNLVFVLFFWSAAAVVAARWSRRDINNKDCVGIVLVTITTSQTNKQANKRRDLKKIFWLSLKEILIKKNK